MCARVRTHIRTPLAYVRPYVHTYDDDVENGVDDVADGDCDDVDEGAVVEDGDGDCGDDYDDNDESAGDHDDACLFCCMMRMYGDL